MKKTSTEFKKILILRTIGNFLIFSSLFFIVKTFYKPVFAEITYYRDQALQKTYVVPTLEEIDTLKTDKTNSKTDTVGNLSSAFKEKNVEVLIPVNTDFSIVVPKIAANAPIIPNIDAGNEEDYLEALHKGVAHAQGTAFPGEGGHMFYFAHSTDYVWNVGTYNAVFYLLYKLEEGDEVNIFYKGERYVYIVSGREIINSDEVEYIQRKTDNEFLTLQTCWPPGTTLKRLLIFAERVVE